MTALIPMALIPLDAAKAAHMAEVDPHGFILTIVSVSVVFTALIILFFCYSLVGKFCTGAVTRAFRSIFRKKKKAGAPDSDTAAAIAMALELELSSPEEEIAAAISLGLDRYLNEYIHDSESYIITIKRK